MKRNLWRTSVLALTSALLPLPHAATGQASLADGFEVTTYASGFDEPIALSFAPDGRLFVAEQGGRIWVVSADGATWSPFVQLEVYRFAECGLLGLALDPAFEQNGYVYAFATVKSDEQQIIRWTEVNGVGTDATPIRDGLPTSGSVHNGGCLRVGPDDKLYFSIGDTGNSSLSQQMTTFAGKICRINLDGSTPADNPFVTPTGEPRAIYALGFRNPFRFCFAPDGRLFVMDVGSNGPNRREEINLVGPGDNGGWPDAEGIVDDAPAPQYINPIYAYQDEGAAISGCVYYADGSFPDEYHGDLFHVDYVSQAIYQADLDGDRVVGHAPFVLAEGGPVDLVEGPDGALYFSELLSGEVKRMAFANSDGSPDDGVGGGIGEPGGGEGEASNGPSTGGRVASPCGSGAAVAFLVLFIGLSLARGRRAS